MDIFQILNKIKSSPISEFNIYIQGHLQEIKTTISKLDKNASNNSHSDCCIEIVSVLTSKYAGFVSPEITALYSYLAFYFKRIRNPAFVYACLNHISDPIIEARLSAWYQYITYVSSSSHINRFETYLKKLSCGFSELEDYSEEIFEDLYAYYEQYAHIPGFHLKFQDAELSVRYPILKEFTIRLRKQAIHLLPAQPSDKIYTPSEDAESIFQEQIVKQIKEHPATNWSKILCGYDLFTVRSQILNFGQSDFDSSYGSLTSKDIVSLYCYLNMRKHYFSSMYLFDRCPWVRRVISKTGCLKFIDIGCGPATSGLAFIDFLNSINAASSTFDYFGVDSFNTMLEMAQKMMAFRRYTPCSIQKYLKDLEELQMEYLGHSSCIIINMCYLFASPSLDPLTLAENVNAIFSHYSGPRFILSQIFMYINWP